MPLDYRGKLYATVNERLAIAHGDTGKPVGIQSVTTEPISLPSSDGGVVVIRAVVTFADGRTFTGISEAQFDAIKGAEKTNPIEVAETSAVGRALAMAGYFGSEEGIAGAEEVQEARRRENAPARRAAPVDILREPPDDGAPAIGEAAPDARSQGGPPATPAQLTTIQRMAKAAGKQIDTAGLSKARASAIIDGLIKEMGTLRPS